MKFLWRFYDYFFPKRFDILALPRDIIIRILLLLDDRSLTYWNLACKFHISLQNLPIITTPNFREINRISHLHSERNFLGSLIYYRNYCNSTYFSKLSTSKKNIEITSHFLQSNYGIIEYGEMSISLFFEPEYLDVFTIFSLYSRRKSLVQEVKNYTFLRTLEYLDNTLHSITIHTWPDCQLNSEITILLNKYQYLYMCLRCRELEKLIEPEELDIWSHQHRCSDWIGIANLKADTSKLQDTITEMYNKIVEILMDS